MTRLLAALCCLFLLGGCGGSPAPAATKTPSSSASKASTTPTPPAMPPSAQHNDATGAEAFVRYWVDVINNAQSTLRTVELGAASTDDCNPCAAAIRRMNQLRAEGGRLEGGKWVLVNVDLGSRGADRAVVPATLTINASRQVVKEPGKPQKIHPPTQVRYLLALRWSGSGWKVSAWSAV